MKMFNEQMTRFNTILQTGYIGEATSLGFAGAAGGLGFVDSITPFAALLGALIAIISGLYTLRLKRLSYIKMKKELEDYTEDREIIEASRR